MITTDIHEILNDAPAGSTEIIFGIQIPDSRVLTIGLSQKNENEANSTA